MAKTNAEKCRDYRNKKRKRKIKKIQKTSTERVREFRERQNRECQLRERQNELSQIKNRMPSTQNDDLTVQNNESDQIKQQKESPTSALEEELLQKMDVLPDKSIESYKECSQVIRPLKKYIIENNNKQALTLVKEIEKVLKYLIKNEKGKA